MFHERRSFRILFKELVSVVVSILRAKGLLLPVGGLRESLQQHVFMIERKELVPL